MSYSGTTVHSPSQPGDSAARKERAALRIAWAWQPAIFGACLSISCAAGFLFGRLSNAVSDVAAEHGPSLEYYLPQESFSEIGNTRTALKALCTQFLTELRTFHGPQSGAGNNSLYQHEPLQAIRALEGGIEQFKGTEEELLLTQELLFLLKKSGQHNRWMDSYLAVLYRHPTHELIRQAANEAIRMCERSGRQRELSQAFEFLSQIPLQFPAKDRAIIAARELSRAELSAALHRPSVVGTAIHQ